METGITQNTFYVKKLFNVVDAAHRNILKPIHVTQRSYDVFSYTLSGSCTYTLDDGTEYNLKKGDILFFPRTQKYTVQTNEPNYKYIFCDFLIEGDMNFRSQVFTPRNIEYAENLFRKLHNRYNTPSKTSIAESISLFYEIYSLLIKTASPDYIAHTTRHKIADAKTYIDINFKTPSLSISELAESINMSEVYFRKIFKAQFGTSPSQYIISSRLNKAKELMKYPFLSLEDCALQSGFSSLQYFCRVFKKATGTTPHIYRNRE